MNIKDIVNTAKILEKYQEQENCFVEGQHDIIYLKPPKNISKEDMQEMVKIGWSFKDNYFEINT